MRHAILITSATFDSDSGIEPLRFPANDVAELNALFQTDDFKFDQITTLIDQPKHGIEEMLDLILSKNSFSDFMMIYFSGHGKLNARGDLFCRAVTQKTLRSTALDLSIDI
jgi:Caspase domain